MWGCHNPNLSLLWSWRELARVIMTLDGHRCPVPRPRKAVQMMKSWLPVLFLSLEVPLLRPVMFIWALQTFGMMSSRKFSPFDTMISASLALCSQRG